MTAINFNFISNNIKGRKSTKKQIKLFSFNQGNRTKIER